MTFIDQKSTICDNYKKTVGLQKMKYMLLRSPRALI